MQPQTSQIHIVQPILTSDSFRGSLRAHRRAPLQRDLHHPSHHTIAQQLLGYALSSRFVQTNAGRNRYIQAFHAAMHGYRYQLITTFSGQTA